MKKRSNKKTEPAEPIVEDPTNPDIRPPTEFDESEDTAVNEAPADLLRESVRPDNWDGPTHEAAAAEMAALVASSAEAVAALDADVEAELPASSSPARIESVLESVLFASDRPLPVGELKRLVGERAGAKVTAALETLSIVAYRQPITRPEVDDVRGVDCGPVLKTLLDRGLVRMIGKKEEVGRPILYGTTPEFLRIFSLKDLAELPTLREFHELGAAEMAKVDAEAPLGAEAAVKSDQKDGEPAKAARQLDPEEDDELLTELERAAAAAVKAAEATEVTTAPPDAPPEEAPPPAPATE